MRTSKKFASRLFPTLFCLIALLLAGCAGASNTPHTKKPSPAPASQQIFRYALAGDITTFDPTQTQDVDSAYAIEGVFTGLVQLDDSLHIKGQMATSWNKSLDGLTWTFHMRSGLQFSDGMPLNANDVAYSIDRALQKDTQSPVALTYLGLIKDSEKLNTGSIKTIIGDSLIVQDNNTLVIKLNKPAAFFLYALTYPTSFPVEKSLVEKYGSKWTDHLTEGGGDGPFKVSVYSHTKGITLIPNANYYGPQPQLQMLQLPFYDSPENRYLAYAANQLDYTGLDLLQAQFETDKTLPDFHHVPSLLIFYVAMNYLTKPFNDIKIRQAFALALDKNFLVHTVLKDSVNATNHIVPEGQPGYNPHLTGPERSTSKGDNAKARQLLQAGMQEEGWSTISQMPQIRLPYVSFSQQVVLAMIQRWQTILGVTVTPVLVSSSQLLDEINAATNNPKGIQMWCIGWVADYPDPQDWLTLQFDKGSLNNNTNYGQNQSFDADEQQQVQQQLEAADVLQDSVARYTAYNALEQALVNDVAWLPLWQGAENYRLKAYVQGYIVNPILVIPPDDWANIYIAVH